jgi:uncharacterized protein
MPDYRLDSGQLLRSPFKSHQGHLRVDAYATRTGVFEYLEYQADGSIRKRRELRHPDQVFDSASLATLPGLPATLLHPDEPVSPDNFGRHGIGVVGDELEVINPYIRISGNIQRSDGIAAIEGGVEECSLGYKCRVVPEAGEWEGEKYDHRQYDIEYNHWAIVPKGRAGAAVKVKTDSADSIRYDSIAVQVKHDSMPTELTTPKGSLTLGSRSFNIDAGYVQVEPYWLEDIWSKLQKSESKMVDVNKLSEALTSIASQFGITMTADLTDESAVTTMDSIAAKVKELSGKVAKIDTLEGENIALKKQLEVMTTTTEKADSTDTDQQRIDAAVNEKLDLLLTAKTLLGADYKHDGKNAVTVMKDVYLAFDADQKFDGLSDETIKGMYLVASNQLAKQATKNDAAIQPAKKAISESHKDAQSGATDEITQKRDAMTASRRRKPATA